MDPKVYAVFMEQSLDVFNGRSDMLKVMFLESFKFVCDTTGVEFKHTYELDEIKEWHTMPHYWKLVKEYSLESDTPEPVLAPIKKHKKTSESVIKPIVDNKKSKTISRMITMAFMLAPLILFLIIIFLLETFCTFKPIAERQFNYDGHSHPIALAEGLTIYGTYLSGIAFIHLWHVE